MAINLLPTDFGPNPAVTKLSAQLRRFAAGIFFLILLTVAGSFAGYVYLGSRINDRELVSQNLTTSIEALESSEQKIILLKDRASKASQVLAAANAHEQIDLVEVLVDMLPQNARIGETVVFTDKISAAVSLENAQDVSQLINVIDASQAYSLVALESLVYNENSGYEVHLVLHR